MENNDYGYYDIEYTPAIGLYYINLLLKNCVSKTIPLYSVFLIFPLFNDDSFLKYVNKRKKTKSLNQLINDYIILNKTNEFWIDYSLRFETSRRMCFESIFLGILMHSFKIHNGGITLERDKTLHIVLENVSKKEAIEKIGEMLNDLTYQDLLRIMKVGEQSDKNKKNNIMVK